MPSHVHAFTLLEALVAVAIFALLLGLGLPTLSPLIHGQQIKSTTLSLAAALTHARSESIKRRRPVLVESIGGDWKNGWRVYADLNGNGQLDSAEPVLAQGNVTRGVVIRGNAPVQHYVRYIPQGNAELRSGGFQAGTLSLCHQDGKSTIRKLIISVTGRVRRSQSPAGAC